MPHFELWATGNYVILDFPVCNSREAGGKMGIGEYWLGEGGLLLCTNLGLLRHPLSSPDVQLWLPLDSVFCLPRLGPG